jgi:hypothetical protein
MKKNWPAHVVYAPLPIYAPEHRTASSTPLADVRLVTSLTPQPVTITPVTDPTHPAHGQYGLTPHKRLSKGDFILVYAGKVVYRDEASDTSDYVLGVGEDLAMDAELFGNEARFINDYRGIAARPNVEFQLVTRTCHAQPYLPPQHVYMGVFALTQVAKGEELLVNYGKAFWKARGLL